MSQQQPMNMAAMAGGPVGGGGAGGQSIGTPGSITALNGLDAVKKLNTAIYDYLLRNQLHEAARSFVSQMDVETDTKKSPSQRLGGQLSNGNIDDGMDVDSKDIKNLPDDLPPPAQLGDGPFLKDWWCQFWEIYQGNRGKGKQSMMGYVGAQRQAQKARTNMMGNSMDPASMQNMRGYNMVMNNGMNDLKRQAMQNPRNMTPAQQAQMQNLMRQQNAQMQASQMERQGSQMGMDGPRSGSPGSGDAPSPKRQRLDGNMPAMNQGRPGPPNQMQSSQVGPQSNFTPPSDPSLAQTQDLLRAQGIDVERIPPQQLANLSMQPANHQVKAVEVYSASIQQQMKTAMQANSSNTMNKGMPPNTTTMGPAGSQGSPMSQTGMDNANGEFYAANGRMGQMPNAAAAQAGANGNHALQDYQMQLMLLEQQNKKRLLMARQEQDSMAHPTGVGPNGQPFTAGMSPSGSRAGDPSPNPNDMARGTPNMKKAGMSPNSGDLAGRGSPQPGMIDPNMNPQIRQMMQNGQMPGMRGPPPSSHPHPMGAQMTPEQMQMFAQRQGPGMQMPNGAWQGQPSGGPQMMPGPGGPHPMPQQIPPNVTPKMPQGNMGPPAPPGPQNGTQPSSPAQPPAPPTPSQTNKPKPGKKGEANKKANKKGGAANQTGATPASEAEAQPPTPTPATPMTPMAHNSFSHQQNKNQSNGQQPPNAANQPPQQNQIPPGANAVQQPAPDMGGPPFGNLDGADQFGAMNMDFAGLDGADVLDNFDFDSFLNTDDNVMAGFDANFAFGDSIEAGPDLPGN